MTSIHPTIALPPAGGVTHSGPSEASQPIAGLSPAGLIVPTSGSDPSGYTRSASGLLIPAAAGVQQLGQRAIVLAPSHARVDADSMLTQAREGHAQLAAKSGREAADLLYGTTFTILADLAAQERHDEAVSQFLAGRIPTSG